MRVLVKRVSSETTRGGIIIVETKRARSTIGKIIAKGPDCVWIEEGDYVFFSVHGGFELPIEGYEEVVCLNEEDLLGKAEVDEKELI
jgi:co-chaperonin GroES (HSP10)